MKLHLLLTVLATASAHYHATFGVPAAASIWQLENSGGETRITGGLPSYGNLHPFFAGLLIALPMNLTSVCGSTLLTDTKLITAGHCWYDGERQAMLFEVVLASVRLFTGGTRVITDDVIPHEAYKPETIYNDIAIITVPTVQFSEFIRPISLPDNLFSSYEGRVASVVGYGKTGDANDITGSQSLRFAFVTVKPKEECAMYGSYFGSSMICTNGIFGGPCGGDSGGPLFITESSEEKYLIGVVSYGSVYGCEAGHPTVFTRISSFIDWIYDKICD